MVVQGTVSLVLLSLIVLCQTQDYEDWIRKTDELGTTLSFPCQDYPNHPRPNDGDPPIDQDATIESWMLPNLTIIDCGYDAGNIRVSDNCSELFVSDIARTDLGLYHCLLRQANNDLFMVKWGLNARGPYFEDLWEKYQTNFVISVSAAGGFTLLVLATCLIYQYRYVDPEEYTDSTGNGSKNVNNGWQDNLGFNSDVSYANNDEPVVVKNSKMTPKQRLDDLHENFADNDTKF